MTPFRASNDQISGFTSAHPPQTSSIERPAMKKVKKKNFLKKQQSKTTKICGCEQLTCKNWRRENDSKFKS